MHFRTNIMLKQGLLMELSDRETLVKLEEQLKNSNDNQKSIIVNQSEIFGRIDKQSKEIFDVKMKLHTILETSSIRKEQIDSKLKDNIENIETIKKDTEERKGFESEIKGSLKILKWFGGVGILFVAILQLIAFIYFNGGGK